MYEDKTAGNNLAGTSDSAWDTETISKEERGLRDTQRTKLRRRVEQQTMGKR